MREIILEFGGKDKTICFCEQCNETKTINSKNFTEVNAELKKIGWIARKVNGEWYDFCSIKCYEKFVKGE